MDRRPAPFPRESFHRKKAFPLSAAASGFSLRFYESVSVCFGSWGWAPLSRLNQDENRFYINAQFVDSPGLDVLRRYVGPGNMVLQ